MAGRHKSVARTLASGIQRYILRISFRGMLLWNCPYCGHFNRSALNAWTWRVYCNGKLDPKLHTEAMSDEERTHRAWICKRWFIYSLALIPIPPGRCVRPTDTIPNEGLIERMPLGEFIRYPRWLSGDGVNRIVDYPDHPPFCCLHNVKGDCDKV